MENPNDSPWENLAIIFQDVINAESTISELLQSSNSQLENLETLTISGNTLIGAPSTTTLHVIGTTNESYFYKDSSKIIFHEIADLETSRNLLNVFSSNNINAKHLQILLKGAAGRYFPTLPVEMCRLKNLEKLAANSINLQNVPQAIENLQNLEDLNLSNNALKDLPQGIEKLSKLKRLYLRRNPFDKLPINIFALPNLQYLTLESTNINKLPSDLYKLTNLRSLDLSNTNISELPNQVTDINSLIRLGINYNKLTTLPVNIRKLKNLTHLYASHNNISSLPSEIKYLQVLRYLDLSNNLLTSLPDEIIKLSLLETFDARNNKLDIPLEIIEKTNDPQAILSYWGNIRSFSTLVALFQEADNKLRQRVPHLINEAKMIFVGQGAVGKTSLIQRILHNTFDQAQTKTDGISINQWLVEGDTKREIDGQPQSEIRLNIWDFGGQEIMHATHQFFLTKRSLYLLVLDARLTQEENRVEYWLKIIQSFGGESPVLIVGNKTDQHPLDIDRTGLQKKYPNIVGILETSAKEGKGIEELKAEIAKQVNTLPHVRDLLPETWFTVKSKLEELGKDKNFITQDEYLSLCGANDVTDETSQHTLIGFLHDLGVVLHFQDDPRLEALGILNPQWVTNGVYKILNSKELFQNQGVLTLSLLNSILNLPEYPRGEKRMYIVDMMKKFELCYDVEPDKEFLIPDLLPKDEPDGIEVNSVAAFQYLYPVLPSSVITRFVVCMNKYIENNIAWRTGVVLKIGNNRAIVKADIEDKKISIYIDGVEHTRRDALSAIRYQLEEIHDTIKGLNPQKRVPIPEAPNAEPLEYDYLLQLERDGFEEHPVKDGNRLVKINVRKLLSGIESEAQRKETGGNVTNIYVGGNFDGNLTIGDGNKSIKDSYNKIAAAKIDPELMQTLKQLADAVSTMTKDIPKEQVAEITDDLGKLVDEAIKAKPNKRWYSVSIDGLTKAAENLDKLGEPVINLSKKVLSLLTGGVIS